MQLYAMGSDFQPDTLVEGYESLIWTERYLPCGDFELTTADITKTRSLLPLESMVTHAETREIMIVETHEIKSDPDGKSLLTVKGRSFESFFENRVARPDNFEELNWFYPIASTSPTGSAYADQSIDWKPYNGVGASAADHAGSIIVNKCIESTRDGQQIPNLDVFLDVATRNGPVRTLVIKPGNLYERVIECLALDDLGIRTNRPEVGTNPRMSVWLYAGRDRTDTVVLSVSAGHIVNPKYLWTTKEYKNMAWSFSYYDWRTQSTGTFSGLKRRIGFVDATDVKAADSDKAQTSDPEPLAARGWSYLREHKKMTGFECEVAADIPYRYRVHYNLGDTVKVLAEYGVKQDMVVTEYVRTEDSDGDRGYPTLEVI